MRGSKRPLKQRRSPSQVDIAREAQVSTATVSRVLNTPHIVRPEVRERVVKVMDRLGYFPHGVARALASNRSRTIGVVVPTLDNDIFARGINALMGRLRDSAYTLVVASSEYSLDAEAVLIRRLLERGIDGLVLVGREHRPEALNLLRRTELPYVNCYTTAREGYGHAIGFCNLTAAASVVDHLLALGHTRVGMLAAITEDNDRAAERFAGTRDRLRENGLELATKREIRYSIDDARAAFREILAGGERPTALVCGNDVIAMGVLFEAGAHGIRVPEELSLVGFDNHPMTPHLRPSITTIDVPAKQMGVLAAEALLKSLNDGEPIRSVLLDAPLLVRETTAPPAS